MQEQLLSFQFFYVPSIPFQFPEDLRRHKWNLFQPCFWFGFCVSSCTPEDPEGQKCIFLFLYQINIEFIKVFRVFRDITNIHTIKPKHGWRLPREALQILRFSLQGLQEHEQQIEHIWIQQNFCFLLNIFLRLKYQKNMAPKKSKVKKPKVKKRVALPAKGIIERTICAHPMLKRVQKEVRELKKKSVIKYRK